MNSDKNIPKWKYWLSHIGEVLIERSPSDINPDMYVSLIKGRMQLCTKNAIYSYEDRYDNFRLLFEQIDLNKHRFDEVLLLGLGLGSVPLLIDLSGARVNHMTLVELDPEVLRLAEKYSLNQLTTPYKTHCVDAKIFVERHHETYDLILSDVFLDDEIPAYFQSPPYVENLSKILTPGGLIIMNTLASTAKDKELSATYFNQVFKQRFPNAEMRHVWENHMLLNRSINM